MRKKYYIYWYILDDMERKNLRYFVKELKGNLYILADREYAIANVDIKHYYFPISPDYFYEIKDADFMHDIITNSFKRGQ